MTTIHTLVPDIYQYIRENGVPSVTAVTPPPVVRDGTLRLSKMGPQCPCALWYSIHHPELAQPVEPWAQVKFTFGHCVEAIALTLIKAAGHEVTGEQDELYLDGIRGHRDCVVDGCVLDVKSSSSKGMAKFRDGSLANDDPFGYLDQLDGYTLASADDPLVRCKDRAYILAIDKQLGHMVTYEHTVRPERIKERIKLYKQLVAQPSPPNCTCRVIPDGKSGNLRLDTKASYSSFKYCCFDNLRTFIYSDGPRYLTRVVRKPDVTEVDRFGKVVYN